MTYARRDAPDWAKQLLSGDRILVLGCPGAGKTTIAKRLRSVTGLPLTHLDDEHWGPEWQRPAPDVWVRRQRELAKRSSWIIEGNYLATVPLRAERAAVVLVLDVPTAKCLARVLYRVVKISAGDRSALPAAMRDLPAEGRVRATKDFGSLLRTISRFRRRDFWPLLESARSRAAPAVIVAVAGRRPGARVAEVRRGLRERSWPAVVIEAAELKALLSTSEV